MSVHTVDDSVMFSMLLVTCYKKLFNYHKGVRLLGVKVSNFTDESCGVAQSLFDYEDDFVSKVIMKKIF